MKTDKQVAAKARRLLKLFKAEQLSLEAKLAVRPITATVTARDWWQVDLSITKIRISTLEELF